MKIEIIKLAGGALLPVNDDEADKLTKFKTGEQYTIEIKQARNPKFHRKVFCFFNFCFQYWDGATNHPYLNRQAQFDMFRRQLTVLAGYKEVSYKLDGSLRVEAKSLSFGSMSQTEFEQCYHSLIQASMTHLFKSDDQATLNQLYSFF